MIPVVREICTNKMAFGILGAETFRHYIHMWMEVSNQQILYLNFKMDYNVQTYILSLQIFNCTIGAVTLKRISFLFSCLF